MSNDRRKLRDLVTVSEISLRLSSELQLEPLYELVVFYGTVLLSSSWAALYVRRDPEGPFEHAVGYEHGVDEPIERNAPGRALPVDIALRAQNEPVLIQSQSSLAPLVRRSEGDGVTLIAPVRGKRDLLGVLVVGGFLSDIGDAAYERELVALLASQAGVAIENALLYTELDRQVVARTRALQEERDKVDELLCNTLPRSAVAELKRDGYVKPRRHDEATVVFTDFVGFTSSSERVAAEDLVAALQTCYDRFDQIVATHGLEKLKTIGDSYMFVAGVPEGRADHAEASVQAALAILRQMERLREERLTADVGGWDIRIGIHSGPVVSGVIGRTKFAFDIWGDTVNVASRIVEGCPANSVLVSQDTHARLSGLVRSVARGKLKLRGRGEIDVFEVLSID